MTELNNPDVRQSILAGRVKNGEQLNAQELALEFDISLDTIRRDILSLENSGLVRRVRGGALPISKPMVPLSARSVFPKPGVDEIARKAATHVQDGMALILDGGTTALVLAKLLGDKKNCLVITPSPLVADVTSSSGAETMLIGGMMSPYGGISVGTNAVGALNSVAADVCFLGACALHSQFGLSSDHLEESCMKIAMAGAADRRIVLTTSDKLEQRSRHKTLDVQDIDLLITNTDKTDASEFAEAGLEVEYA